MNPDNTVGLSKFKVPYSHLGEKKVKEVYIDKYFNVSLNPDNFCSSDTISLEKLGDMENCEMVKWFEKE